MESKDQKDPIGNDQFGDAEATSNSTNSPNEAQKPEEQSIVDDETSTNITEDTNKDDSKHNAPNDASADNEQQEEPKGEEKSPIEEIAAKGEDSSDDDEDVDAEEDEDEEEDHDEESTEPREQVDYSKLSKEELAIRLAELIENKPVNRIRADVESIKINFYKKHKAENELKRKEWVEAGGSIEEFQTPEDAVEPQIKEWLKQYRDKKSIFNRELEDQKAKNLEVKQAIIEEIKELVNRNESVNQTFQDFRQLQQKWREVGPVPQASLNDLWETYHHHVQNFYDYVKINKELKDLDLKKNLEEKILLCEKAEAPAPLERNPQTMKRRASMPDPSKNLTP